MASLSSRVTAFVKKFPTNRQFGITRFTAKPPQYVISFSGIDPDYPQQGIYLNVALVGGRYGSAGAETACLNMLDWLFTNIDSTMVIRAVGGISIVEIGSNEYVNIPVEVNYLG